MPRLPRRRYDYARSGWSVQVECCDCSAHTVYVEYNNEEEKKEAEQAVIRLWNIGKVVTSERGE